MSESHVVQRLLRALGLSAPPRLDAVPPSLTAKAEIPGMPGVRYVGGGDMTDFFRASLDGLRREQDYLARRGHKGPLPPAAVPGHLRRRRQRRVHRRAAQRVDGGGDPARIQARHRHQHRRVDRAIRLPGAEVRRDAQGILYHHLAKGRDRAAQLHQGRSQRRDGQQRAAVEAHAQVRDRGVPERGRRGIREGPLRDDRHRRHRCAPPDHLGHGQDCDLRRAQGPGPVRQRHDCLSLPSGGLPAGDDRCGGRR